MSADPDRSAKSVDPVDAAHTEGTSGISGTDTISVGGRRLRIINPEEEYRYWENNYASRDYVNRRLAYGISYGPAYRYGAQAFNNYQGASYESLDEAVLRSGWDNFRAQSTLSWKEAKDAIRDAYERLASLE